MSGPRRPGTPGRSRSTSSPPGETGAASLGGLIALTAAPNGNDLRSRLHLDKRARVPCSLGYHFIMRDGNLDVTYYIQSCDVHRHFRDDVYLTIRLLLWVLNECRLAAPEQDWADVKPGQLIMHITSLHMFQADHKRIYKEPKP